VDDVRIFYGVGRIEVHIPHSHSLKDRRSVMKGLKERISERLKVSVVDAGPQELWQRGALGICTVGRDEAQVRETLSSLIRLVEREDRVIVLDYATRIGCLDDEPQEGEEE
jgi:uncharacterized protein YlxP (DUF503 family)